MKRQILIAVGIVLAVLAILVGIKLPQIKALMAFGAAYAPPPETIGTAMAHEEAWSESIGAVGSINAEQGINVSAEIAGAVKEIIFDSGAEVAKGDLLVKLDTSSEAAQLRAAQAQADLAKIGVERLRKLRADGTASQSELDQAEASFQQTKANAELLQSAIDKKNIRAPFSGRLGIWQVSLGQLLAVGQPLISLQNLSPVFADFSLPQQDLAKLKTGLAVRVSSDTYPEQKFEGELAAINPDLDAASRSVKLRAKVLNAEKLLRPGMFVRADVMLPGDQTVLVIPSTALISAPYGDSVFVIETKVEKGKTNQVAQQKFVRTGRAKGDFVSVVFGLKNGDKVATAGVFKLRNGTAVVENNVDTIKPSTTPNPPNS